MFTTALVYAAVMFALAGVISFAVALLIKTLFVLIRLATRRKT